MTPLESRKQLLLLESELNRAQLLKDLEMVKDAAHRMATQAQALGLLAGSATTILTFLGKLREIFTEAVGAKKHGNGRMAQILGLLEGAHICASLWEKLHSCRR